MKQRSLSMIIAVLAVLLALPAFAGTIQLRQSNGTLTDQSGTGGAADVNMATLLACEDQPNNLCMVSGGAVRGKTMASAVTTDTTSAAVALPTGSKSIYGSVTGTGPIAQTQKIYGGITSGVTSTTGILLCTLTLGGTTAVYDACPVMTANFLYYIVVTSSTSGTSASGTVTAMY
jgi:hypothetical protein